MTTDDTQKELEEIEEQMKATDFWIDKEMAQATIAEYNKLKDFIAGVDQFDKGDAVLTIFAGAGGADAEDFAQILFDMYLKYIEKKGWTARILHENKNDHGGIRNITIDVIGRNSYGSLKHEAGVHRLVRISPFNARKQRHTSFVMVDVVPAVEKQSGIEIKDDEIDVHFTKSSGPGGQNVNKRETAVRITHKSTGITVHVDGERTQERNREKALSILQGKLFLLEEEKRKKAHQGHSIAATTDAQWGNQIRSYVFHPYQMVKDHRTNLEIRDVDSVIDGNIQPFVDASENFEKST